MAEGIGAIGAVGIIIGLLIAFFGWKLHRFFVALLGFIMGGIFGAIIFGAIKVEGASLAGFLVIGVFSAILALFIEKVYVAVLTGMTGASIIGELTKQEVVTGHFFFIPITETNYNWGAIIAAFIAFAVLGWYLYKAIWMLLTAAIGATIVAIGSGGLGASAEAAFGVGATVFIIGAVFQAFQKRHRESVQIPQPREPNKFLAETHKLFTDQVTQYQAIGAVFYLFGLLVYSVFGSPLSIGSFIFLLLAIYVIAKIRRNETPNLKWLYLLLGIAGLLFALGIGGALFLYSYKRFRKTL